MDHPCGLGRIWKSQRTDVTLAEPRHPDLLSLSLSPSLASGVNGSDLIPLHGDAPLFSAGGDAAAAAAAGDFDAAARQGKSAGRRGPSRALGTCVAFSPVYCAV